MENKKIVIVGGSSGIGLATAQLLRRRGHSITNISRSDCPIEDVQTLRADVTDTNAFAETLQHAAEDGVDALIYSAGFSMAAPVEHAMQKDYRYLFEVNLFGAMQAVQTVLPVMRAQKFGRIVLVGSIGSVIPIAFDAFYSASKAALLAFTRELNLEINPFNVFASCVLPGGTDTRFTFKRKVYSAEQAGDYAPALEKATAALAKIEQGGMEPSRVAETILHTLCCKRPPISAAPGLSNKAYCLSQKILPDRLTTYMTGAKFLQH